MLPLHFAQEAEAGRHGFKLEDFAAACLRRRAAVVYASSWGVKLQEVLVDGCMTGKCSVATVEVHDLLAVWPGALEPCA